MCSERSPDFLEYLEPDNFIKNCQDSVGYATADLKHHHRFPKFKVAEYPFSYLGVPGDCWGFYFQENKHKRHKDVSEKTILAVKMQNHAFSEQERTSHHLHYIRDKCQILDPNNFTMELSTALTNANAVVVEHYGDVDTTRDALKYPLQNDKDEFMPNSIRFEQVNDDSTGPAFYFRFDEMTFPPGNKIEVKVSQNTAYPPKIIK